MRSTLSLAALFAAALAAPEPNSTHCIEVGISGFFPIAFTAFNDVTGQQASSSFSMDSHAREFRYQFDGTGLDNNGVIKATHLRSLTSFKPGYGCNIYDPNNHTETVGRLDNMLGWRDLQIYGGKETDVTGFRIVCDTLIIHYPEWITSPL